MKRALHLLRKLFRSSAAEWSALCRALPLVLVFRLALWTLPFRRIQQWAKRLAESGRPARRVPPAAAVALGVARASRLVPRATRLTQALATQVLLSRAGYSSTVQIGVATDGTQGFEAHAWVECDGEIVIGGGGSRARFRPLLVLEQVRQ